MATVDKFLPMVRGRLPGCPEMILENAIRDACIEFCKRTRLLVQETTADVVSGESAVSLYPDSDTHWDVLDVLRDTTPLRPLNRRVFQELGYHKSSGVPSYYYLEGDLTLVLGPLPDTNETLTVWVSTRPTDTTTRVADVLWTDHRETVAAGARAWVRRNYGDWAEPRLEAEDRAIFERAVHNQNIRRAHGGANTLLRVRGQFI